MLNTKMNRIYIILISCFIGISTQAFAGEPLLAKKLHAKQDPGAIFELLANGLELLLFMQEEQLAKAKDDHWRIEGKGSLAYAYNNFNNKGMFIADMEVHWAAISSEFRYMKSPFTNSIDLQILIMNFVDRKHFRFSAGAGISIIDSEDLTLGEYLVDLQGHFMNRKISPQFRYRVTNKADDDAVSNFREEIQFRLNYHISSPEKGLYTSFFYTQQNWMDMHRFNYVGLQLGYRFF